MPLLDASLVTQALVTLITQSVTVSPEAGKVPGFSVSPLSPDRLSGDHAIGLYLYYITENQQYKNPRPRFPATTFRNVSRPWASISITFLRPIANSSGMLPPYKSRY